MEHDRSNRGYAMHEIECDRNHYFTGKYMTARDFASEQAYLVGRHRLHNRVFHGWGVVCGLEIVKFTDERCADTWVVVKAGIALDCHGRELVLSEDTLLELPLPFPTREFGSPVAVHCQDRENEILDCPFLICLSYTEVGIEEVPVLYGDQCHQKRREHSRIREGVKITFVEAERGCWNGGSLSGGGSGCDECGDCERPGGPETGCLTPICPCGDCVPLALITDFDRCLPENGFRIDLSGRSEIAQKPATSLTRIIDTSWEHRGKVRALDLRTQGSKDVELWVQFDRAIRGEINLNTFSVMKYTDMQQDLEFLQPCAGWPAIDEANPCFARFRFPSRWLRHLDGNFLHITLRCDFIVDCNGNPVDGNHLRGELPTGDGIPGGTFESWFFVDYDDGFATETEEFDVYQGAPE